MNLSPFYAVVSDLDGTLLKPNHRLGQFTKDILQKLTQSNIDIIVATGRPYLDVKEIFAQVPNIKPTLITSNGAIVHNADGQIIFSNYVPSQIAHTLTNLKIDHHKVCINTYENGHWLIDQDVPELKVFHQDSNFTYKITDFSQHQNHNVEKVFFISYEATELAKIEQKILALFADKIQMTYSNPHCLEIMNKKVSKASTLACLLENRSYHLNNCIAFGDGLNDEAMLKAVGKGCVMQNADPRLTSSLMHLEQIGSNGEEAVAHYLQQIFGV